jgi:uncharacterized membrane protein YdjX (TVP38/TMEM64 family)
LVADPRKINDKMTDIFIHWLQSWSHLNFASFAALALVFVVSGVMLIPRTFLCLAAGSIFGPAAIPVILPSTTAAAMIAFLLARYVFRDRLQRTLDRRPNLRAIADAIDSESWRVVGLLRLGSPIPTAVQSYFFGLTRIGFWPFTFATFVFTLPQIVLYVYLGAAGRAVLLDEESGALRTLLPVIGVVTLATVTFLVARKARAAVRRFSELNE